jgi:3-hydroxyacyl-CoA dehydrogenase
VIEAIVEDREIKASLFKELDAVVKEECVLTSTTSSIRPERICPSQQRVDNFAALHFFYPVQYSTLLEIMGCSGSSSGTVERLRKFGWEIGKTPLVLPQQGAFILNKLASYVNNVAVWLYTERILTYKEIDELMKKHLFVMGAFEFADSVGIDTIVAATKIYMQDMDYAEYFTCSIESSKEVTDKGDLGIKTGKGWYSYTLGVDDEPYRPVQPMGDMEREKYKEAAVEKMVCAYINMCYDAVSRGYLTEEEVETAMEVYPGFEKGPGQLAKEFGGLPAIHEMLLRHHRETGWGVYRPCAFIENKVRRE